MKHLTSVALLLAGVLVLRAPAQEGPRHPGVADEAVREAARRLVAQRQHVLESGLRVLNVASADEEADGTRYYVAKVIDAATGATHHVRLDVNGTPAPGEMRVAGRFAQRARRIDPVLERDLAAAAGGTRVPVAIWLRETPAPDHDRPAPGQARTLLSRRGGARTFFARLGERRRQRLAAIAAPLVDRLRARGVPASSADRSPVVFATVPADIVHELAGWPEVERVFADVVNEPELPVARRATKAHVVHNRRFTGQGVQIAQIEVGGRVSASNPYLTDIVQDETPGGVCATVSDHSTWVAGIARSTHPEVRGIAPGVTLWAGGSCNGASSGLDQAAERAIAWGARALNISWGYSGGLAPGLNDRFYDDLALNQHVLVVKSAGNRASSECGATDGYITSPGLGYNVLTVGALNDRDTVAANLPAPDGDTMDTCSSYVNPTSAHGDREKPEVVAPGYRIRTTTPTDPWVFPDGPSPSGTSFAAPIVTAAAALLMNRDPALAVWPEAIRAILMATATQNVSGSMRLSDRDGAGAISLEKADDTAWRRVNTRGRRTADWDGFELTCNPTLPTGQVMTTTVEGVRGKRIRAAIAWNTDPNYENYELEPSADLDLQLLDPSGHIAAASASFDNAFEIIDYTPIQAGTYTFRVTVARCDVSPRYVGWAWWSAP